MFRTASIAAALLLAAAPAFAQDAHSSLTLTFETGANTGQVLVALYDAEAAYNGGAPVRSALAAPADGKATAVFADLPRGAYAARAFHDVNGNGKMDTNPFGMPVEPFAFTNNAVGNMGPARWAQAQVQVEGAVAQTIAIR